MPRENKESLTKNIHISRILTFIVSTLSCIDQHCVISIHRFIMSLAESWRPSLCQQYHVSTDIVSFLSSHLLNSIVPCGKTLEIFIVSTLLCIDRHCIISIKPFIEQYCAMWQDIGDLHCVNNIMYRPTLYHFYKAIY